MTDLPLYFELHIRPMFREIDYLHMKQRGVDLWDASVVSKSVDRIIRFLTQPDPDQVMPAQDSGGPWPPEWVALIKRWRDDFGSQSLPLGLGAYSIDKDTPRAGWCTLRATGSPSAAGTAVWVGSVPGPAKSP